MKCENIILLAGRPASGKTEMMIAYANQFEIDKLVELNLIVKMIITPIILNLMKITEILLVIKMEIF